MNKRSRLTLDEYYKGILNNNLLVLSQAITLTESTLPSDQALAAQLIEQLLPSTGKAKRIGITGVPGVGKSTFIESFGMFLVEKGHRLAVLTIDPSSSKTKGSILGDKTRMEKLSSHPNAYIRPSASGKSLGGVGNATRESLLLCDAFGFDIILVETVGVGQSETLVKNMVDFFLLMMLAGAGDELQGIKKGIMEMADILIINKADGDNLPATKKAKAEYTSALRLFPTGPGGWKPEVLLTSSLSGEGIQQVWDKINDFFTLYNSNGLLLSLRRQQRIHWFEEMIDILLQRTFHERKGIREKMELEKKRVADGVVTPLAAARQLVG